MKGNSTTEGAAAMATHTEYTKKAQAWRKAHGKADGQDKDLIKAVREAGYDKEQVSDFEIIEAVGYADTPAGAVKKIRVFISDRELDAAEERAAEPASA
jgi:hypothetical protein